ncbi:unnamed protein product, partial [Pleuronectes platessa]
MYRPNIGSRPVAPHGVAVRWLFSFFSWAAGLCPSTVQKAGRWRGTGYCGRRLRLWTCVGPFSRITSATAPAWGTLHSRGGPLRRLLIKNVSVYTMASSAALSKANTSFCLDLFKKFSDKDKAANVFYSPFSISSALAMVMLGARGNTHTQMSEVLSFCEAVKPQPGGAEQRQMQQHVQMQKSLKTQNCLDDVHADFSKLLKTLNKAGAPYSLSVANRLYGEQSYQFVEVCVHDGVCKYMLMLPGFQGETRKYYNAELESVDFKTGSEAARLKINGWVEEQTQDKIKDLLLKGTVHDMTRMVLVNAIYFKGDWNKQFEESATRDAQFRLNKNESKQVKMMYQNTTLPLGLIAESNCQESAVMREKRNTKKGDREKRKNIAVYHYLWKNPNTTTV